MKTSIAVAVSGGADSLRALALLKGAGREVLALHARLLPGDPAASPAETGLAEACRQLDLPFHILDLTAEFARLVIEPFSLAYAAGLTPNPCAACNAAIKFGLLAEAAQGLGAERFATGHYAGMLEHPDFGRVLTRGLDPAKDQSYFLALVRAERLSRAEFPLAARYKRDSSGELSAFGLTPPLPSESQEICFIPGDDYRAFLTGRGLTDTPGPIRTTDGRTVGRHQGLWRHTPGQRRGLGVAWTEPLYVLAKDIAANTLIVGVASELRSAVCRVEGFNALVRPSLWPERVLAQTRYRQSARPVTPAWDGAPGASSLTLTFHEPVTRPAPGQLAVLFTPEGVVLGGGIIAQEP